MVEQEYAEIVYCFPASKPESVHDRGTAPALLKQLPASEETALYMVIPVISVGGMKRTFTEVESVTVMLTFGGSESE